MREHYHILELVNLKRNLQFDRLSYNIQISINIPHQSTRILIDFNRSKTSISGSQNLNEKSINS